MFIFNESFELGLAQTWCNVEKAYTMLAILFDPDQYFVLVR